MDSSTLNSSDEKNIGLYNQNEDAIRKRLLRRVDWNVVGILVFIYAVNFLDRVAVGQAKLEGMLEDINVSDKQFQIALTVFYISYMVSEIPWNMLTKRIGPQRTIPLMALTWSVVCTLTGIVKNYPGLLAVRWFLGLGEGGIFPGMIFFLSAWYPRKKLAFRISTVYNASQFAGAFGGIFSYALAQLDGVGGLRGWRWIIIIEGLLSFIIAFTSIFCIQDFPQKSKLLNEDEKGVWFRYIEEQQGVAESKNVPFTMGQVTSVLKDRRTYMFSAINYCNGSLFYALATWIPTIIKSLGDFDAAQSHLLTAPVYVCGIIVTFTAAWLSDHFQQRGILCIIGFVVSGIGFIIILSVQAVSGKFFSLFLMVSGTNICNAGLLSWFGATYAPLYKRAFAVGFIVMLGNCGGLVSSFIYPESTAPRFIPGHAYCLALALTGLIVASILRWTIKRENKRRDKVGDKDILMGMSDLDIALLGDKHPQFRYVI
ncbi:MFS general substrate transporter [Wallemia mellicola CBS 633.66]|uniref:MFS general substrate transporter n=1 Tax=Wallemia mellicola (strain ATCC MYA-4683 / CBS 633.66) TaxID=671144 RepID=I4YJG1_WALMC|nr:MFS general substrate transporter [Wallemia mellicola CBS 633.66]EIM24103.1 MFS general substrate transporter [Wallemia mellicola CBS 633.66]|eukprot:XP_006955929.1 MFS general substrate transporter [Wallemia mellicola CBS 633.66]